MAAEPVELHKLKLAELKQECLARGLEAKGNKQDLIHRLQAYLEEHAEEEPNEEDVLGEEIEENSPKSPQIPQSPMPVFPFRVSQRMQKRAERFNVPISLESKKAARAINLEKLKERAQRFGLNVSSLSKKSEEDEKLKKRKE
ncbi:PREDICTED: SAP domain-containing ribonucleoprotein, partial [Sturnus vulgaris]|uniref:SAP domain-containing ribonucleoprotein n=1 Tax=Sturnus vulgaris TaxID=9172 RepID=UPI00071A7B20